MREHQRRTGIYIALTLIALVVLIPFYWMLATALKSESEALLVPATLYPHELHFENFWKALTYAPFLTYFFNTLLVAAIVVVCSTVISVLAAFAFAQLQFPGKNLLFLLVLATMMIPQEMLIITNFMTIAHWKWLNTIQALVLPFCVNAFNIYLLRQSMLQIPGELYTASKIDGLSDFRFLRKVVLPIVKPTVLTIMILSMIWIWNTYAWPNLVTTQDNLRMVSNGLQNAFTNSTGNIQYELQMSAATMVTVPLILVFLCFRKHILAGMSKGGLKG